MGGPAGKSMPLAAAQYLDSAWRNFTGAPSRVPALLKARRQLNVIEAKPEALDDLFMRSNPDAYEAGGRMYGFYSPSAKEVWHRAGDRPSLRHELMHGIYDIARNDESVRAALPRWLKYPQKYAPFEDELLARLASGQSSQLVDWPVNNYAELDPVPYAVLGGLQTAASTARGVAPYALGAAIGSGGLLTAAAYVDKPEMESARGGEPTAQEIMRRRRPAQLQDLGR